MSDGVEAAAVGRRLVLSSHGVGRAASQAHPTRGVAA
jgi:hypothetical protein